MAYFKNKNHKNRDYEATNIVCCDAKVAPGDEWVPCEKEELKGIERLWRQGEVVYYEYL